MDSPKTPTFVFNIPTQAFENVGNGYLTITARGYGTQPELSVRFTTSDVPNSPLRIEHPDTVSVVEEVPSSAPARVPNTDITFFQEADLSDDSSDEENVSNTHALALIETRLQENPGVSAIDRPDYGTFKLPMVASELGAWNRCLDKKATTFEKRCCLTGTPIEDDDKYFVWGSHDDNSLVLVYSWPAILNLLRYHGGAMQPPLFNRTATNRALKFYPTCIHDEAREEKEADQEFVDKYIDPVTQGVSYPMEIEYLINEWRESNAKTIKGNLRACPICFQLLQQKCLKRDRECVKRREESTTGAYPPPCKEFDHCACHHDRDAEYDINVIDYDPVSVLSYLLKHKFNIHHVFHKRLEDVQTHLTNDHGLDLTPYKKSELNEVVLRPWSVRDADGIISRISVQKGIRSGTGYLKGYWGEYRAWRGVLWNMVTSADEDEWEDWPAAVDYVETADEAREWLESQPLVGQPKSSDSDNESDNESDNFINDGEVGYETPSDLESSASLRSSSSYSRSSGTSEFMERALPATSGQILEEAGRRNGTKRQRNQRFSRNGGGRRGKRTRRIRRNVISSSSESE